MNKGINNLERVVEALRALVRRHWQRALRIREKVWLSEEAFHLVMAGVVGIMGGAVNYMFHLAMSGSEMIFLNKSGELTEVAQTLNLWHRLLTPAVGGLFAGLVLYWGLRLAGEQRSSNILEVVSTSDGRLPFRIGMVKALSSLVSIGSGASIGSEGAITELAAMFASKTGHLAGWQPYRLRLLTACGAASGIAAAYNAPIAGAVFASLIVLGNFSMNLFAPVIFASVIATMFTRVFFRVNSWYEIPPYDFNSLGKLPWFLVLGLLAGIVGAGFLKMLQASQKAFRRIAPVIYWRLVLGGLVVGVITLNYPGVWGNGYGITNSILHGRFLTMTYPLLFVLGLLAAKLVATLASVGSGAEGGVFTPTLFLGAALGAALGTALHNLHLGTELPTGAFALVGMGAMLAATTRSPLLAMIMVFELSVNYSVMPPLMLACVISTLVARRLHPESIYTQPLRNKGLELDRDSMRHGSAMEQTVGDLMHAPVPPVRENAPLREIAERFLTSPNNFLPVVDAKGRLIGLVALHDLKEYLNAGAELSAVIAYDVMRPPPVCVMPDQLLMDTLPVMLASEQRNVPVVNSRAENRLIGAVLRSEVLGLLSEAIATRGQGRGGPAESAVDEKKEGEGAGKGA